MRSKTDWFVKYLQARSSVGERYIDTVEVGSSILPAPTKRKAVRDDKRESPAKCGDSF